MTFIYDIIRDELKPNYKELQLYDKYFKTVYDKIVHLLIVNGTLIKTKGKVTIPKDFFLKVIDCGLQIMTGKNDTKQTRMEFKDMINLLSFYILDEYNEQELFKGVNNNE